MNKILIPIPIVVLGLPALIIFGFVDLSTKIDLGQVLEIIILAVLVVVTTIYAERTSSIAAATKQQADASVKMAEAVSKPIVAIDWIGPSPDTREDTAVVVKNIGVGPALNLKCYFTHPKFTFQYKDEGYTVVGVEEQHNISLRHENFDREKAGLAINCDYQSISGKKFHSRLRFETAEKRYFEIEIL